MCSPLLDGAGLAAVEVRRGQKGPFFDDPAHLAAGMVASYTHTEWGRLEQPGALWYFGDQDVKLDRAPPLVGEHSVEVLLEVGLSPAEIDAAIAAGAVVARDDENTSEESSCPMNVLEPGRRRRSRSGWTGWSRMPRSSSSCRGTPAPSTPAT